MNRALIVFDSAYGNTAKVAEAIGATLAERYETRVESLSDATGSDLSGIDLLVVGSPTQGGRATKNMQDFITRLPEKSLQGIDVAAFDTRFALNDHGLGLRLLMGVIGFAAERIAGELVSKGGRQVVPPEGFIVVDKEGPLEAGELERAAVWIRQAVVV